MQALCQRLRSRLKQPPSVIRFAAGPDAEETGRRVAAFKRLLESDDFILFLNWCSEVAAHNLARINDAEATEAQMRVAIAGVKIAEEIPDGMIRELSAALAAAAEQKKALDKTQEKESTYHAD